MPLLTCPNDNAAMTPVTREGVEIDMCPQCRGVWLDRGELEKLLSVVRQPELAEPYPQARHPERRDHRDLDDDDQYRHRRKKRFDLFDIFD